MTRREWRFDSINANFTASIPFWFLHDWFECGIWLCVCCCLYVHSLLIKMLIYAYINHLTFVEFVYCLAMAAIWNERSPFRITHIQKDVFDDSKSNLSLCFVHKRINLVILARKLVGIFRALCFIKNWLKAYNPIRIYHEQYINLLSVSFVLH